jgi:hypothetical protein
MTYNHSKQYRCTIVRGKAFNDLDNLLILYASIVNDICPCEANDFESLFNQRLSSYLGADVKIKTINNHRTEIVGKLFGMYYKGNDNCIYCSPRVNKLLEDSDQPAYFKELLLKYQFPTGMSKIASVVEQISLGISFRQFPFIINFLKLAKSNKLIISKKEIGYYILNNLDVLTGKASPKEVLFQITKDRSQKIKREIIANGRASSYTSQHINEQLNLLVLANLIYYESDLIIINEREDQFLNYIASLDYSVTLFNFTNYNLINATDRIIAESEWDIYFAGATDLNPSIFKTSAIALSRKNNYLKPEAKDSNNLPSTVEIGDEGEAYVFNYEIQRINKINPRLVNRVKLFGKIRGLGYDIHSIYGEGKNADFVKYIEVKSTKRVTSPGDIFLDSINLTKNEWSAAQQHGDTFHIYRLYLTNDGVKMFVIINPFMQSNNGEVSVESIAYRLEFNQNAGHYLNEKV